MMSAMSASPVKPVLPSTGVNVPPPVATSPPKVGMMQIPATLTIAPSKPPASINHAPMPLSLITEKLNMPQQYTPPNQPGIPPSMPISQPLPRTPEKPKDLTAPVAMSIKPTSNGMEGLVAQNQPNPTLHPVPAVPDVQISAVPPPPQKVEAPVAPEVPDFNAPQTQTLPENSAEPPPASAAPLVEPDVEKKTEPIPPKPLEPVSKTIPAPPQPQSAPAPAPVPFPQPQEATPAIPAPTPAPAVPTPTPAPPTAATAPSTTATAPPTAPAPAPTQAPPPPAEQPVAPSVSRTETSLPHNKPEMKVATIPRQATKRKREPKVVPETPEVKKEGKDEDRKSKRVRLPTQPYQSPLPELNIIAKINKSSKSTPTKAADDKLIVFYKNEFLAVRNAEGGFYVCQAMQNIYKSSPRIRIRWLSLEEGKDTYSPDFYDHTDFDCILTNLNLDKIDKEKFKLPAEEQQRTQSILKRALDVEKGVSEKPPVTEEHPDGLDLSLFRDESQLKKSSKNKSGKRSVKSDGGESTSNEEEDEAEEDNEEEQEETVKKTPPKTSKRKKKSAKKKAPPPKEKKAEVAKSATSNNKSTVQPAKKKTETRVGSKRKSSVSSNTQPPEKKTRKSDTSSQPSDRTNKTRSAGAEAAVGVKSRRDRRAKSRK